VGIYVNRMFIVAGFIILFVGFIGFTIVVVGLFYKPEEVKTLEVKQENP